MTNDLSSMTRQVEYHATKDLAQAKKSSKGHEEETGKVENRSPMEGGASGITDEVIRGTKTCFERKEDCTEGTHQTASRDAAEHLQGVWRSACSGPE